MTTDTPRFIEPDDVEGGYAPLPIFVTRPTLSKTLVINPAANIFPNSPSSVDDSALGCVVRERIHPKEVGT